VGKELNNVTALVQRTAVAWQQRAMPVTKRLTAVVSPTHATPAHRILVRSLTEVAQKFVIQTAKPTGPAQYLHVTPVIILKVEFVKYRLANLTQNNLVQYLTAKAKKLVLKTAVLTVHVWQQVVTPVIQ
jgi:hypothetical protein